MRSADLVVAQTSDQAAMLQDNYGITVDRVIPNFHPVPQHCGTKDENTTLVWIANLKDVKRPELVIEAASRLADLPSVRFKVVGAPYIEGDKQAQFESAVRELDNLEYLGKLPQEDVNALLCRSHMLVNTSVAEGFSNTFIQAWMREVPVLTVGVNPDNMLNDSSFGKCCGSVDELVDSIRHYVQQPGRLQEMGEASYAKSIEIFSMRNAEQLAELILQVARNAAIQRSRGEFK
jgi:glycosyltransferase involved in cell wall biosynthesis